MTDRDFHMSRRQGRSDVYRFDPLEWLGGELTAPSTPANGSDTGRGLQLATPLPLDGGRDSPETIPQELLRDVRKAHQRMRATQNSLRSDALRQFTDRLRRDTALLEITASLIAPHLLKVYRYKQASEHPTGIRPDETAPATNEEQLEQVRAHLVPLIGAVFEAARKDGFDIWQSLAEWIWAQLVAWALDTMDQDLGTNAVRALSEEDFNTRLNGYLGDTEQGDVYRDRYNYLLLTYSPELARFVVESLDLPKASTTRLEQLIGLRPLKPSEVLPAKGATTSRNLLAPLLTEGHFTVMSSAHYHALREALYKNTFQRVEGTPWPTAQLQKGNSLGHAQLRPPAADGQALMPVDEVDKLATLMWQQREELSDLDADVLDALSALWLHQARSIQDRAVADVNELLAMRGIKPKLSGQGRRGGYGPEQRSEMMKALSHIQNLWLNMAEVEVYEDNGRDGRRRKPVKKAVQSRPFVITDQTGQMRMDGLLDVEHFIFRPGEVFAYFLMGPGHQTALLSVKALKYDYYRQKWEKRLARYLSWQWRAKARNGEYLRPYRVATLLEAAGEDVNQGKPSRTRDRLEQALEVLQQDSVIAAWQYDRWDEAVADRRGWAQEWLRATVLIEPPDAVKDQYQRLERQDSVRHRAALPEGLADRIKRHRKEVGLSQLQAAEQIGISQAYLSLLERGKATEEKLSQSVRKVLREWLGE